MKTVCLSLIPAAVLVAILALAIALWVREAAPKRHAAWPTGGLSGAEIQELLD